MEAAGLRPVRLGRLDARISSRLLVVPDPIFRLLAGAMIRIDPTARSSMAEDLEGGRKTEIDFLNGAIVRLGAQHGVPTPVNRRVVEAIHAAERGEPRAHTPETLLAQLRTNLGRSDRRDIPNAEDEDPQRHEEAHVAHG
jgi:2-dehydropantoate 2-reductase